MSTLTPASALLGSRTQKKIARRLLPFLCVLYCRLSGPSQRCVCEAFHDGGPPLHRSRLWTWCRDLFHRLPIARDSWRANRGALECSTMVRSYPGKLGTLHGLSWFCQDTGSVLPRALFVGSGRGWILPGRHRISYALVPAQVAFSVAGRLHRCDSGIACHRCAHLGIDSTTKLVRSCGMALGLYPRGPSRDCTRHHHAVLSDRPSAGCDLA